MPTRKGSIRYYMGVLGLSDKMVRKALKIEGGRAKLDLLVVNQDPSLKLPYINLFESDNNKPPYEIVELNTPLTHKDVQKILAEKNNNTLVNLARYSIGYD